MARKKRKVPGLNGSSLADISFILLIFFLITTSMDTDTGLVRRLPPPPDPNQLEEDVKVKGRNVLVVQVNMNNEILYYYGDEAKRVTVTGVQPGDLRKIAKEFIANPENKANMPEFHPADPPLPLLGAYPVTKNHIISVQTDRSTKYEVYFQIQNELMAAYNELRDEFAREKFGKYFRDLTEDERLAVTGVYPMKISEAEPKKYGGN
ncbi:MAG: biopolymer transporter ExbD [Bacteroidaceae bacterium]|nr:biopolymer transporter ExbD [Bacteroidaceae bacterium]MBR6602152.1 biopolymer transporter ExbD [Bacteroidaceae bacterium]